MMQTNHFRMAVAMLAAALAAVLLAVGARPTEATFPG